MLCMPTDPTPLLSIQQALIIRQQCEAVSVAYARAVDFRDYDACLALFTEDGVLDVGKPMIGRASIQKSFSKRPDELRSRHVLTNIFIDPIDPEHARGISYLTLYRHVGKESLARDPIAFDGPAAIGHYEDRFVCVNPELQTWLFESRKLHLAFRQAKLFPTKN